MISSLPNIERCRFDHDKNKLFICSIFFPNQVFHILCYHDQNKSPETLLDYLSKWYILPYLYCVLVSQSTTPLLFLLTLSLKKNKRFNFVHSNIYRFWSKKNTVVSSANCEFFYTATRRVDPIFPGRPPFFHKVEIQLCGERGSTWKRGSRHRVSVIFNDMCLFIYFYLKTIDFLIISYSKSHDFNGKNK